MSQPLDPYRILGLSPDASSEEIRHAYHRLAKQYHPDRVPPQRRGWAREQMARLNAAYEALGDPAGRAEIDRQLGYTGDVRAAPTSIWRAQRIRERSRRIAMERWRSVSIASLIVLALGLLITALFVRSVPGLWIAGLVNLGAAGTLIVSLLMRSR